MIRFDFDTKNVLASEVKCRKVGPSRLATNVSRATRSLGFGERDVLSSTNVAKVHNVSIKHNTQIFGARCYKLYAAICSGQIIS
jgi:hypothetical protein